MMERFIAFVTDNALIILFLLVIVFLILLILLLNKREKFPYVKKELLSKSEKEFYYELYKYACQKDYLVFTKVRLADFCEVDTEKLFKDKYMKYFAKIRAKHVDFLLCDKNLKILAAIELDDKSHNYKAAKENDEFKNKLYKTIDIKLVRVKISKSYDIEKLLYEK